MSTVVYDNDHHHTGTALGTCKGCGGTLWQTSGLPEKCDRCEEPINAVEAGEKPESDQPEREDGDGDGQTSPPEHRDSPPKSRARTKRKG